MRHDIGTVATRGLHSSRAVAKSICEFVHCRASRVSRLSEAYYSGRVPMVLLVQLAHELDTAGGALAYPLLALTSDINISNGGTDHATK